MKSRFLEVTGLAVLVALWAGVGLGQTGTYTDDADFDQGTIINVNHTTVADQLQLNITARPFPYISIAASARGTIVRIDVNSGEVLGEYLTSPDGMARNPSRTTVDKFGNTWVTNRDEYGISGGVPKGSITRVGLVIGGTRVGEFLEPPFAYSTCQDRNLDGLIKTSSGLGDVRPWANAGGADSDGGISTSEDECITAYTRVTGTGTRTVVIDAENDVWVGGYGNQEHEKLDGVTAQPVPGTQFNLGCGGYGGVMDCQGVLWSSTGCGGLLRFDPSTPPSPGAGTCLGTVPYGLGIDPTTGRVWGSELCGDQVRELDFDGSVLASYPQGFQAQGMCVDGNSHVWVAEVYYNYQTRLLHLAPDPDNPGSHLFVGYVEGFLGTTGVAVDTNGKIWASELYGDSAARVDPNAGPIGGGGYPIGAIDLKVSIGAGAQPYNYSDMTGAVTLSNPPFGVWNVVRDGGCGTSWNEVSWTSTEPANTSLEVEARVANAQTLLSSQAFFPVANGVPFAPITGRFIEIRVTFRVGKDGCGQPITPILQELTVHGSGSSCDDDNPCTNDTCDPATGSCSFVADDGNVCTDGEICTVDACVEGACIGAPLTCDDGNPCTDDACDPATGCIFGANDACSVDVEKVCGVIDQQTGEAPAGIVVTNTGETSLVNCAVSDALAGYTSSRFDLEPAASIEFDILVAGLTQDTLNEAAVTCDIAETGANSGNVVQDGSFEDGTPNSFWDESSTTFGTPLCDPDSCPQDVAYDGTWYAWFGGAGTGVLEEARLKQSVVLPSGIAAALTFRLAPFCSGVATDFFEVLVAGTTVFKIDMTDARCDPKYHALETVDLSAHLGTIFDLEFHGLTGTTGRNSNIFLDDVRIVAVQVAAQTIMHLDQDVCERCPANCDDGNPCTDDSCDPTLGCVHPANSAACDDGDACTEDACAAGQCVGTAVSCDDGNECTEETCDPAAGCLYTETPTFGCAAPRTIGFYKRLCAGPHPEDELTQANADCVNDSATFSWVAAVGDICDVLDPQPANDKCEQAESQLMALLLNACKRRVENAQVVVAGCSEHATVGETIAHADALLSNASRSRDDCVHAQCESEGINSEEALGTASLHLGPVEPPELVLRFARSAGGGVQLTWSAAPSSAGWPVPTGYRVWRRPSGVPGVFGLLAEVVGLSYADPTLDDASYDYQVTAVRP